MPESTLIILTLFLLLSFSLTVLLLRALLKNQSSLVRLHQDLLRDQRSENQILRNQLRSPDVPTLLGLNNATLPSDATASNEQGGPVVDLGEAIAYEEELAKAGYSISDLGDDLASHGWNNPVTRRDGDDVIAYE